MQFIVGLFIGGFIGAVGMALLAAGKDGPTIDDCQECRTNLCNSCQDLKALEEELMTCKRSKSQIVSENGRLKMAVARN